MKDRWFQVGDDPPKWVSDLSDAELDDFEQSIRDGSNEDTAGAEDETLLFRIEVERIKRAKNL